MSGKSLRFAHWRSWAIDGRYVGGSYQSLLARANEIHYRIWKTLICPSGRVGPVSMSMITRASRNLSRTKVRSAAVVLIVGLSLGVFLTMTIVEANISAQASEASGAVDTTLTVRPAGAFGFFSSAEMNESVLSTIEGVAHVEGAQPVILAREGGGAPPQGGGGPGGPGAFARVVLVQGEDPALPLVVFGGGTLSITEGRTLAAADNLSAVALVGSSYASNNNYVVGSSFALNGTIFTVVGIYSTGNQFGDNGVLIPYALAKTTYNASGPTTVYVKVDEPGNMEPAQADLNATLGDGYDVVPLSQNQGQAIQNAVNAIRGSSELGSLTSLATAFGVLAFVMAWATRERRTEIGVMRAIGFGRGKLIAQFMAEAATLAVGGFLVSLVVVVWLGPSIAGFVAGSQAATTPTAGPGGTPGSGPGGGGFGGAQFLVPSLVSGMDFSLQPSVVLVALGAALGTAVAGSVFPLIRSVRMRPSEALRDE